ncbi:MAG: OmpA family protein [Myxococcota bacterium]
MNPLMGAMWVLLASTAGAPPPGGSDAVSVQVVRRVLTGARPPELIVNVHEALRGIQVHLRVSGQSVEHELVSPSAGQSWAIPIALNEPGRFEVEGSVSVTFLDGTVDALPVRWTVHVVAPLLLEISATPETVEQGHVTVRSADGRPLDHFRMSLIGPGERVLRELSGDMPHDGVLRWSPPSERVVRIDLQVHAEDTAYREHALFPWRLEVPHEEVNFESGSHAVPAREVSKLDASLQRIRAALADVRPWADAKLFIVGHTDRVGTASANLRLSLARARSIGRWFRSAGLEVPIRIAGLGELRPLVATEDDVPEVANRRVDYILAVEIPKLAPDVRWKSL